ncbi:MAG: hypothetical protein ACR2N3_07880 [Pyrinomonadaceae bacterium]
MYSTQNGWQVYSSEIKCLLKSGASFNKNPAWACWFQILTPEKPLQFEQIA